MEGYTTPVPLIDHLEVIDFAFYAAIRVALGIAPVNQTSLPRCLTAQNPP
jgi:hypothetical protein